MDKTDRYQIREATEADIDFIIEAIIEAEKSLSDRCGLAGLLAMTINETRSLLRKMLNEDIDGCEFSLSSFLIAEYKEIPVATVGGWMEKNNEGGLSSALIKANLIGYFIPAEKRDVLFANGKIISGVNFEREKVYNLEYVYTLPEHRHRNLAGQLIAAHIEKAKYKTDRMQVQVFGNNVPAIGCYEKAGFKIADRRESTHEEILNFMPDKVKILMELSLKDK